MKETNVSGPINFTSKEMIDAQLKKITADIEFYKRALITKLTIPLDAEVNYSCLITSSFSQQEYQEITAQQLDAINKIYDAMLASRKGLKGLVASGQINNIRNTRVKQHKEDAEKIGRIYKPQDKQENKQPDAQELSQTK